MLHPVERGPRLHRWLRRKPIHGRDTSVWQRTAWPEIAQRPGLKAIPVGREVCAGAKQSRRQFIATSCAKQGQDRATDNPRWDCRKGWSQSIERPFFPCAYGVSNPVMKAGPVFGTRSEDLPAPRMARAIYPEQGAGPKPALLFSGVRPPFAPKSGRLRCGPTYSVANRRP